jgi:hypothetical protein
MFRIYTERKGALTLVKMKMTILLTLFGVTLLGVVAPRADAAENDVQGSSVLATWNCTGTPCPWGDQTSDQAVVWPAVAEPIRVRHGYTVSHDVYATAQKVLGWEVSVTGGNATVYAGIPSGSHSSLASLQAGQSFTVPALGTGFVVSVQSDAGFRYTVEEGSVPPSSPPPAPACTDPTACDPVSWIASEWRYNGPDTDPGPWFGGVIAWPSWSAYSSNNRAGENSRTVYSESGEELYPYMGEWADGCEVEVVSGGVLIVEWERGLDEWRETNLSAGDSYTINLVDSENGAMIETQNNSEPFEVSLSNCTPQQIDKGSSD